MTGSLAYRKNEAAILRGEVPEKYTRLLPLIPGDRVIELGSAEGVLALLLAKAGRTVTAVERQAERHEAAKRLASAWGVGGVTFVRGDITGTVSLLDGHDTLVAIRMIYYLGDELEPLFREIARRIPNVMLCGNKNRAAQWRQGIPDKPGVQNYYASAEGMRALIERHGYTITAEERDGDPIVVGHRDLD